MHTLTVYEPGHFHAALTLRRTNPRVAPDVHVYARPGPELDAFEALVRSFNERDEEPTAWRLHVHAGEDPLERLIAERRGDIVVMAGRNDGKLAAIARLHAAGLHVLADKPWVTDASGRERLDAITAGPPLAMDIMTERHDTVAMLRKHLLGDDRLLGAAVREGPEPAFEIGSVHHLYKLVNGQPLRRPPWYYDVRVQGDGLVDIQTHMTDQAQWLIAGEAELDFERDFEVESVRRWSTEVPRELFEASTGLAAFPPELSHRVRGDTLHLECNGEIVYRLLGVRVRQTAEWGQREPPGSGDLHRAVVRGERGELRVNHNALAGHAPEITVQPAAGLDPEALGAAHREALEAAFPGIGVEAAGEVLRLHLPEALRTSHEAHFAMVLEEFLDHVDAGTWPAALPARIRARHRLLARAHGMAAERAAERTADRAADGEVPA